MRELDIDDPDVLDLIRRGLIAAQADIVVNQVGILIFNDGEHFWELTNRTRTELCLSHYFRFKRNGRPINPLARISREFVNHALAEQWFKMEYRGPCPACQH